MRVIDATPECAASHRFLKLENKAFASLGAKLTSAREEDNRLVTVDGQAIGSIPDPLNRGG
jgi:hypothetical protein